MSTLSDRVSEILRSTAARAVLPRFAALQPGDTTMKAPEEPVTIADREAEIILSRELCLLLPDARAVGEEACSRNAGLIETLGQGIVWLIDPIDGTRNFAAGRAPFAMMVALLNDGETVGSWILDPLTDRLAVAERGGGAWLAGERLQSDGRARASGRITGIVSEAFLPPDRRHVVEALRANSAEVVPTARCAGFEYPLVAAGERDFALYWRTLAWDHAPGALFLEEAGGRVRHLDGAPYRPTAPRPGLLLARDPEISERFLELIARSGPS